MRLYFLRHGIAAERDTWQGSDADRPLTVEGARIVGKVGKAIGRLGLNLRQVLSSDYLRARQTAQIVGRILGMEPQLEPRLAPGFDIDRLTQLLDDWADEDNLLLVGHEPDFGETISALVGGAVVGGVRLRCKKAGLVRVDLDGRRPRQGVLAWILPPKLLLML